FGWAPRGGRAHHRDFFVRGWRFSVLPALSLDGILHLEILDHAFTGETFLDFIEGLLGRMQPWPQANSVLVMDNATIHHVAGLQELVEGRYVIWAWLRRHRAYVLHNTEGPLAEPYAVLWEAVYTTCTPTNAHGWFRHSEYIA
ncbi:hypothetical protein K474DRAFT_1582734, partial [Panus rudis PR-1116 ss-1]